MDLVLSIDDLFTAFDRRGIGYEFNAYVLLVAASRLCVETRGLGTSMSSTNPLHGLMFWYLVQNYFMMLVVHQNIKIPGLSTTDAIGDGLSSFDKVQMICDAQVPLLKAACAVNQVPIPDFSTFFFQKASSRPVAEEQGEDEEEGSGGGSGGDASD